MYTTESNNTCGLSDKFLIAWSKIRKSEKNQKISSAYQFIEEELKIKKHQRAWRMWECCKVSLYDMGGSPSSPGPNDRGAVTWPMVAHPTPQLPHPVIFDIVSPPAAMWPRCRRYLPGRRFKGIPRIPSSFSGWQTEQAAIAVTALRTPASSPRI